LREIIPRYGLPLSIGSDNNGPAFMAEIVQGLAKILKIKGKLHTAHRPQSSEKVEHINQTLKTTLAKLC
jgi:transposase InsO family protein